MLLRPSPPPAQTLTILLAVAALLLAAPTGAEEPRARDLKRLSLEQLLETEFVSLSKKPERRGQAAAAVSIITGEDIKRSGVRSIPEALRLAPGTQVARVDSNKWAIGIRGFASRLSGAQLALMDGRSLYTPLFAGIYWEVQDTFLEDIDRIEVIRGPGGALWGANAVNGIVNILTKSAKDTQGVLLQGGGGTEERGFGGFRYGGTLGEATHFRVYGKYFDRDAGRSPGIRDFDDWSMGQVGFRSDTDLPGGDLFTLQGDLYGGETGQRTTVSLPDPPFAELRERDADLSGGNVLGRWTRSLGAASEVSVQLYYDQTFRREPNFREQRDTVDLDVQHHFPLATWNDIVWGFGYRFSGDRTGGVDGLPPSFTPNDRDIDLWSAFVQDEIVVVPERLRFTIGSKFEHNDFSGFEFQPSGRVLWTPAGSHVLWASVTRAVRTPSRIEHDVLLAGLFEPTRPTFFRLEGDEGFDAERVFAYEVGYRVEPVVGVFVDLAGFFNRYEDFLGIETGVPVTEGDRLVLPFVLANGLRGDVYGGELLVDYEPLPWWRLRGSYSYLQIDFRSKAGFVDAGQTSRSTEGSSPHHQASFQSSADLLDRLALDLWLRYVDRLPAQRVDSYVTFDARLGWQATPNLEVSLVGQNLVEASHVEFGSGANRVAVERGGYGAVTWRW